jgi:metal-dependent amidase/aminoacylase/carboxypeptidase family protein
MTSTGEILAGYDGIRADQEALYQELHAHPELSHAEHRTSKRVAELLAQNGYTVHAGIGGTGVAGVLTSGHGPVVLLRAELDGSPSPRTRQHRSRVRIR